MEKSYRGWGSELTTEIDMFEASMERFIRLDKEDFIGKAPTLVNKQRGPRMKLVYMEVDDTDSDCMGNEPVYHGGKVVGVTTSGAFGHKVEQVAGLRLCRSEAGGRGHGVRRHGLHRDAQGPHHPRVDLGCRERKAEGLAPRRGHR